MMFGSLGGEGDRGDLPDRLRSILAGKVPISAVKARREELGFSQHGLARVSGVSQPVISRVETGERLLTSDVARRLSVALKMSEHDLGLNENLSLMKRFATKGKLPPEAAVGVALRLLETQPDSEAGRHVQDAVLEALVEIAKAASATWTGVATKGSQKGAARDHHGRVIDKKYSPKGQGEPEGPRRDASGKRLNKKYDPRRYQER